MSSDVITVLGAGPTGLGAALRLARRGVKVEIFERADQVGGLARSISLWGQQIEFGAHLLLLEDPRITCLWRELIGSSYDAAPRETKIITKDGVFLYPYDPIDVVRQLKPMRTATCVLGMLRRPHGRNDDGSLEEWIVERFGYPTFETLIADYSHKHFGRPASEIDADLADSLLGFQRRPSIGAVLGSSLRRRPEPPVVRPHGGVGMLMERMREDIIRHGGRFHLNADIASLRLEGGRVRSMRVGGSDREVTDVLSTVPLPILLNTLTGVPDQLLRQLAQLETRGVVLLFALQDGPSPFSGQWIYIADPGSPVGRVTNFSAWSPVDRKPAKTILCFEFWCDPSQSIWKAGSKELSNLALAALSRSKIEARGFEATKIIRKANALPVLQRGYQDRLRPINHWIDEIRGLHTAGRFGAFANSGVHESVLMGMEVADEVLWER